MYIQQTGPIVIPGRFGSGQPYPLKFDSFQTVLNKIMEYSENVVINLKKTIEFLRFPVIFLL